MRQSKHSFIEARVSPLLLRPHASYEFGPQLSIDSTQLSDAPWVRGHGRKQRYGVLCCFNCSASQEWFTPYGVCRYCLHSEKDVIACKSCNAL